MQRPETFSLYPELRVLAWSGAMLLAASAGIVLKNNLERIGPLALAVAIGVAAAACYAWVWWRRARATIADDYILLLGALLVSADLAFIETQFHLLDHHWPKHFLLLAVLHGVAAYAYRSRTLLSLSIAALAAWLGIERRGLDPFRADIEMSPRAYLCAALLIAWREIHRRVVRASGAPFLRVFEHFAANLALWGGLLLWNDDETFRLGCVLTIVVALIVMRWGFIQRSEPFVLYAFAYAVLAIDTLLLNDVRNDTIIYVTVIVSMIAAVVTLIAIHRRFAEARA